MSLKQHHYIKSGEKKGGGVHPDDLKAKTIQEYSAVKGGKVLFKQFKIYKAKIGALLHKSKHTENRCFLRHFSVPFQRTFRNM